MLILILFAFLAGIVTVLSPCILPVLPIVLSSSLSGGKRRPLGVVAGFIVSFTFFTLFLTSIVSLLKIPADSLRTFSIVVIFLFGASLLIPKFQSIFELLFARLSRFTPKSTGSEGFLGGFIIGLSIGLIWTPCVGPILASVISLAITGTVTGLAFFITLAYSLGTAIPMFAIVYGGRNLLNKVPWLLANTARIQKGFGVVMIFVALAIYFNFDRNFQTFILNRFPSYGTNLIKLEENELVEEELDKLRGGQDLNKNDMGKPSSNLLSDFGKAPEIVKGGESFNTGNGDLSVAELKGKVVLIDFWTYTCINCIRTFPYLKTWNDKYKDKGLVIIGIHTPEFEFEKSSENVEKAITDFGIEYPVIQDNNYATWRAYNNRYWPAKYLIDKEGKIRFAHFGEGAYDETELVIQTLLTETGVEVDEEIDNPESNGSVRTPEIYLGHARMDYFWSPGDIAKDSNKIYKFPTTLPIDSFAFEGEWNVHEEYSNPSAGSKIKLHFEGKEVNLGDRARRWSRRLRRSGW